MQCSKSWEYRGGSGQVPDLSDMQTITAIKGENFWNGIMNKMTWEQREKVWLSIFLGGRIEFQSTDKDLPNFKQVLNTEPGYMVHTKSCVFFKQQ